MSICNRPAPASFCGNTVDNVTLSSRTPQSSVPVGRVPLTTLQSGVGTTPFIGQAAGMERFGARVLPGRGNSLPTDDSYQSSSNLAGQVNVRTGRTLTDSSRNSANTVAESGVDSVINSRSSLYMPTFPDDDIDNTILNIDGDNIFDSTDLSRQKTPSGMPSLNSFNVYNTPSTNNGASPHDISFQNSSYSSLVSTMPPQYAATQSMHKLSVQKQCKKDNLEKMYEMVKNHLRQNPQFLLKWQEYFAPEVEAVIEKKFKKHFESAITPYVVGE
jgi:hypothetical protein